MSQDSRLFIRAPKKLSDEEIRDLEVGIRLNFNRHFDWDGEYRRSQGRSTGLLDKGWMSESIFRCYDWTYSKYDGYDLDLENNTYLSIFLGMFWWDNYHRGDFPALYMLDKWIRHNFPEGTTTAYHCSDIECGFDGMDGWADRFLEHFLANPCPRPYGLPKEGEWLFKCEVCKIPMIHGRGSKYENGIEQHHNQCQSCGRGVWSSQRPEKKGG